MKTILLAALIAGIAFPAAAQMPGRDPLAVFDRADTDHDGRISRAEFAAARAATFARMDRNHDGAISKADFGRLARFRPQAGERLDTMIEMLDTDHDGKVTQAEFAAAPTPLFDRGDTNHDGFVDQAELAALRSTVGSLRQAR